MRSLEDLNRAADDAQNYRFRELELQLQKIEGDRRKLAIRLARFLPMASEANSWLTLQQPIRGDLQDDLLDDLHFANVLERADPPTFGHSKRREAAQAWLLQNRREAVASPKRLHSRASLRSSARAASNVSRRA